MKIRTLFKTLFIGGAIAVSVSAADLFKDDFSNCGTTFTSWAPSHPDSMTATCGSGVYTVQNRQKQAAGLMIHAFAQKPAMLTASVAVTRSSDSTPTGFIICLKTSPAIAGYAIQLSSNQALTVFKYGSGGAAQIYANFSSRIRTGAATNIIQVSKSGNKLYLYVNSHFIDQITDATNPLADGDFALLVPKNSTVSFDNVLVTGDVVLPEVTTCLTDNFNDNSSFGWSDISSGATVSEINNSVLSINTLSGGGAYDYHFSDFKMDTFVSKTVLSFRKGNKNSFYGFFFKGPEIGTRVPMALFAISGNKYYSVYTDSTTSVLPVPSTFIKGAPYISGSDTAYFYDTIEVTKSTASPYYYMKVNNNLLDSLPVAKVNFTINGVGIFCSDSLLVHVDSFYVQSKAGDCLGIVKVSPGKRNVRPIQAPEPNQGYMVNPMGRKVYALEYWSSDPGRRTVAPGFYISSNKKSGAVIRK